MNIMFTWNFDIGHPAPTKSTWPQFICALSVHLLACPSLTTPKTSTFTPVIVLILFWDTKHDSEHFVIIYANLVGSCFDFFSRFFFYHWMEFVLDLGVERRKWGQDEQILKIWRNSYTNKWLKTKQDYYVWWLTFLSRLC